MTERVGRTRNIGDVPPATRIDSTIGSRYRFVIERLDLHNHLTLSRKSAACFDTLILWLHGRARAYPPAMLGIPSIRAGAYLTHIATYIYEIESLAIATECQYRLNTTSIFV
jgi:hypothetical protein